MKRSWKRKIVILLAFILVFAGAGNAAFAGKPVKEAKPATIEVVEPTPLLLPLGSSSVSTDLIVMNHTGDLEVSVEVGSAIVEWKSEKRKQTIYTMTYTKPEPYTREGDEYVVVTAYNTDGKPATESIHIEIEMDLPPPNEPPVNTQAPAIDSSFVAGSYASPIYGSWTDDEGSPSIVRTWELSSGTSITENGDLLLDASWVGLTIWLKEVADDGEFQVEAVSEAAEILSATPVNEPPVNTQAPSITSSFVTGDYATPVFGEWSDDSVVVSIVRTWELDGITLSANPNDGNLRLDESWAGKQLVLKEIAEDDDGAATEASSPSYLITAPQPEELRYVALGDSIATGTVAPSLPNEVPYIQAFKTYLETETGRPVTMSDFSEDGDHTGHLLARLGGPSYDGVGADSTMISQVSAADVITVSIGGNNLMSAAKYTTYVLFFIRVDYYDFDRIDTEKAEAGRLAVENDFPSIINKIRQYNPTAKIIVNDLYNPFNKTTDTENYNLVEGYFHRSGVGVNDVIRKTCNDTSGVQYAESYSAFETYANGDGKQNLTYMYILDTYFGFELRNPHPNSLGQSFIENAVEAAYKLLP